MLILKFFSYLLLANKIHCLGLGSVLRDIAGKRFNDWSHVPYVSFPPPGAPTFYPERSENDLILGLLVSPGYFFITLILLVGLALGDSSEYGVSLVLFLFSFFFFRCVFSTCLASFST